jgi:hypothetical protein
MESAGRGGGWGRDSRDGRLLVAVERDSRSAELHRHPADRGHRVPRILSRERGEYLWKHAATEVERTKGGPGAVRAATDILRHQEALYGLGQQTVPVQTDPTPDEMGRWVAALLHSVGVTMPGGSRHFRCAIQRR